MCWTVVVMASPAFVTPFSIDARSPRNANRHERQSELPRSARSRGGEPAGDAMGRFACRRGVRVSSSRQSGLAVSNWALGRWRPKLVRASDARSMSLARSSTASAGPLVAVERCQWVIWTPQRSSMRPSLFKPAASASGVMDLRLRTLGVSPHGSAEQRCRWGRWSRRRRTGWSHRCCTRRAHLDSGTCECVEPPAHTAHL